MKRYLFLFALSLVFQTSYAQLIELPWDNGACRGCRVEMPVDPLATVDEIKTNVTFALMQDGVDSPHVEINPIVGSTSPIRTYRLVIRSKNEIILVTTF